ncbi:TetR/AcrR family transcriptional regulator [Prauserella oleivorans]
MYRHFASKADLLAAVYYRAAERLAVATSTAIESATDPGEALRKLVDAYVAYTYQDSDLAAVYLSEYGNLPPTTGAPCGRSSASTSSSGSGSWWPCGVTPGPRTPGSPCTPR